jgi:hypothetical protein
MPFTLPKIKNKNTMIILAVILVIIIILGLFVFFGSRDSGSESLQSSSLNGQNLPTPEFLSTAEKEKFGLPSEAQVQSLKRDAAGQVLVYKIIRSDQDIVVDPAKITPLSPRQKSSPLK